jgi:hypothetical protein
VAAPITLIPGFSAGTSVSGLTDPHGLVAFIEGFPCCYVIVEQSLNRVSRSDGGPPVAFATGLSTPTDLLAAPPDRGFGNFLYVTESGANRIPRINNAGVVTPFASLPAAPKRMAFSQVGGGSAFGDVLFVTLANGELRKIDPAGVVSPCASGLAGPEGLVFGPGGALRTTVLFVAESTANKISKVDPACTVSPFASTGLSAPVGLAISPQVAWGSPDTLYVVNGGTRGDRVDKNGNVTPFASGFTKANTIRSDSFLPQPNRMGSPLRISDTTAGTIVSIFPIGPTTSLQLAGCNPCRPGETFAVTLSLEYKGPIDLPVEIKTGFRLTDGTPVNLSPLNNKHFEIVLPPGFRFQGLWLSFPLPAVPPGRYCYEAGLIDPDLDTFGFFSSGGRSICFSILP